MNNLLQYFIESYYFQGLLIVSGVMWLVFVLYGLYRSYKLGHSQFGVEIHMIIILLSLVGGIIAPFVILFSPVILAVCSVTYLGKYLAKLGKEKNEM